MNQLIRFRDAIPAEITPRAEEKFHAAMLDERTAERADGRTRDPLRRTRPPRARLAWMLGLSAFVAAALMAGIMVAVQPSSPAILTAQLLADRASAAALAQPAVSPGQWVYRVLDVESPVFPAAGRAVHTQAGWETADGLVTYGAAGTFGVAGGNIPSYSQLGSLPRSPAALDAYLERTHSGVMPALDPHAMAAFSTIELMLENYVLPPALQAEIYRALAALPGIRVDSRVTAIDGRAGVAFVMPRDLQGSVEEIILNPSTYAFMADALFGDKGTLLHEEAVVKQVLVGAPGSTQPSLTPPSPAELLAERAAQAVESLPDNSTYALALLPSQADGSTWVLRQLDTPAGSQAVWATGDDSQQASYVDGKLQVCARTAACAASTRWLMPSGPSYSIVMPKDRPSKLPASIPQLLTTLNSYPTGCDDVAGDCNAVNAIVNMAFGYVTNMDGSWFLLLAGIPRVTVAHLTDVSGQADIALRFPFRDGVTEILFNASDYALVGYVRDGVQTVLTKAIAVTGPGSLKQRCESYLYPVPGC
jgi:hypothetical protein